MGNKDIRDKKFKKPKKTDIKHTKPVSVTSIAPMTVEVVRKKRKPAFEEEE